MKQFVAVYMGSTSGDKMQKWHAMDKAQQQENMKKGQQAWGAWMEKYAKNVVVQGGPLGKTKKTDASGVHDTKNLLTGYVVVTAESHDAAAKMFENHPHFSVFPGESVEIMECMPIPGM